MLLGILAFLGFKSKPNGVDLKVDGDTDGGNLIQYSGSPAMLKDLVGIMAILPYWALWYKWNPAISNWEGITTSTIANTGDIIWIKVAQDCRLDGPWKWYIFPD